MQPSTSQPEAQTPQQQTQPQPSPPQNQNPGKTLGITGFILQFIWGPLGIILGSIGLVKSKKANQSNVFALLAIILGSLRTLAEIGIVITLSALAANSTLSLSSLTPSLNGVGTQPSNNRISQTDLRSTERAITALDSSITGAEVTLTPSGLSDGATIVLAMRSDDPLSAALVHNVLWTTREHLNNPVSYSLLACSTNSNPCSVVDVRSGATTLGLDWGAFGAGIVVTRGVLNTLGAPTSAH